MEIRKKLFFNRIVCALRFLQRLKVANVLLPARYVYVSTPPFSVFRQTYAFDTRLRVTVCCSIPRVLRTFG